MTTELRQDIEIRGGNLAAINCREPEILLEGPAGTGKTRAILVKLNRLAQDHAGFKGLIIRHTAVSLSSTVLRTLEEEVYHEWVTSTRSSHYDGVHFFGGSQNEPAAYVYTNGSTLTIGGMDQASKVLSAFYDVIYACQGEELSEDDFETLKTRCRHFLVPDNRMYVDANPSHSRHWLMQRVAKGLLTHYVSRHQDNPAYYNRDGTLTVNGAAYIKTLEGLTGTRRERLYLGNWIGMENAIYPQLDRAKHIVLVPERVGWGAGAIGVDYGDVHPSAVVAVQRDTHTGVYWVRECWAEGHNLIDIRVQVRSMRTRFRINRGRVDPNQSPTAQVLGFNVAIRGPGTRKQRIDQVATLLDGDALLFDLNGAGVEELFEEMTMYRWEKRETPTVEELVPVRIDDDRVAALEYAIEELMLSEGKQVPSSVTMTREPGRTGYGLGVKKAKV